MDPEWMPTLIFSGLPRTRTKLQEQMCASMMQIMHNMM